MRRNEDLIRPWKLAMPATLAGRIEFALLDSITGKTKYGARNTLVVKLLERWLAEQNGGDPAQLPSVPTLEELRAM